ncbi:MULTISPECIES: hypothetical protein [unclassified Halomonas]|jgi:DnaK suppressor protein|uniref:hypothetical protein n=1 Tax=unclassified Halomonas TaxID=2609666 RepID=UPI001E54D508|nr:MULTISPECIES: hypothetical protein [unclassified Halomonas]
MSEHITHRKQASTDAQGAPVDKVWEAKLLAMPPSDYMNAEQLAFFRQRLLDERAEIEVHLNEMKEVIASRERDSDESDQASFEEELRLALRQADRVSRFVFITQNVAHDTVAELYNFFNSSQEVAQ